MYVQNGDERVREYMPLIVGNDELRRNLCENILSGKLSHAFILEGPTGSGKHTVAMNIAAALACTDDHSSAVPCRTCPTCRKIFSGNCPDVTFVGCEGKATFGVESIRFLKSDVHTVPNDLDFKLYIIEDADKMTVQAQNAFLLTLEEPPSFVRFVLLCENADMLLETIRSRAPVLRTQAVSNDDIDAYLCQNDRRATQMKLTSPDEYAELIMAAKHGIGKAIEYLDPKVFAPVKDMRALAREFCDIATSGAGARAVLPLLSRFSQKRDVLSCQLVVLSEATADLVMLKKSDCAPLEFFADRELCLELCDRVSISFLYDLANAILTAMGSNQRNANVRLTLIKMFSDAKII